MQEKTIKKFQEKIRNLETLVEAERNHGNLYQSRYLKEIEKAEKYEQMWNTAKLFIKELLKNNPELN